MALLSISKNIQKNPGIKKAGPALTPSRGLYFAAFIESLRQRKRAFAFFLLLPVLVLSAFMMWLNPVARREMAASRAQGKAARVEPEWQETPAGLREAFELARYAVEPHGAGDSLRAQNPAHSFMASFDAAGLMIEPGMNAEGARSWRFGMRLEAYGYGGRAVAAADAVPVADGNRVEYRRGHIVEWYINERRGIEQGFTVSEPPLAPGEETGVGPLMLRLAVAGDLRAKAGEDGQSVSFVNDEGGRALLYDQLVAFDAGGRKLSARMSVEGGDVLLSVDDAGAAYPLTIDPFIQQQRLQASDAASNDSFGYSVSLSSDGNTALIGSYRDDNSGGGDAGSAYVFTRSGAVWTEQQRLQASDAASSDFFGYSVALNADGNTALVGARNDTNSGGGFAGSAYVFTRAGAVWTEQQRVQASDAAGFDLFGSSVGLSSDGNTALVGARGDDNSGGTDAGSAYVFTRSGTVWTEQQRLQASDAAAFDNMGELVALSADGNTALAGALSDDNSGGANAGSAYVFTRSGAVWTEQQRLQASDAAASDNFGYSVALSSNGNTAIVGAYKDDNSGGVDAGSAYIFTRSGTVWTEQQRLQASDASASGFFGYSVSLSSDGNTALVGGYQDDNSGGTDAGSAYVFTRAGAVWTEQQLLQAGDAAAFDNFGYSVALSADGNTALVVAFGDDNSGGTDAGSAYVFLLDATSFVVTKTADTNDGVCNADCSLREAITAANADAGAETISFNIPAATDSGCIIGTGVCTISPTSALPAITQAVTIDGYTQTGASANTNPINAGNNAALKIELNGTSAGGGTEGLTITGSGSTIRGLIINRFNSSGIFLSGTGSDGNIIRGNFIGTDATGLIDLGNGGEGIDVSAGLNPSLANIIGGTSPADRNVISGNQGDGIDLFYGEQTVIQGNIIGLAANGTSLLGNSDSGVRLGTASHNSTVGGDDDDDGTLDSIVNARNIVSGNGGNGIETNVGSLIIRGNYIGMDVNGTADRGNSNNGINTNVGASTTIGGTGAGAGNLISGNNGDGIFLGQSSSSTVQGNLIGTQANGTSALGNGGDGLHISITDNVSVGGMAAGQPNTIAHNGGDGVFVQSGTGNSIRRNSIHTNTAQGVDIGASGVTLNDAGDGDTGANNLQNFPLISSAVLTGSGTLVQGSLNSTPTTVFDLDFYANNPGDASNYGEGQTHIGSMQVTTNAGGTVSFSYTSATLVSGGFVTATATDPSGNTSEFALNRQVQAIVVDNTGSNQAFDNAGVSTLTWSHAVGAGTNRALVVGVSTTVTVLPVFPAARVSGVTYGGSPLTRIGTRLSPGNVTATEMFMLVNPPTGTANVVVSFLPLAANYAVGGSVSFTGVNQATPNGAFTSNAGTDDAPAVTVTDSNAGDVVIDTLATDFNIAIGLAPGPNQTERWRGDFGGTFHIGAGSTETASSPVTMSWTTSAPDEWALGAVAIKLAPATPTAILADVSGRATNADGGPLAGVTLTLLDIETSQTRTVVTGVDGRYRFAQAQVGDSYLITPSRAGYSFNPSNHFFAHTGTLNGVDFVGTSSSNIQRAVVNDFDGDGRTDLAVFRPSDETWYIRHSSDNSIRAERFGNDTDRLVPADYDSDGRVDIAVFRPANGHWYIIESATGLMRAQHFGQEGDVPVPADYDGDGRADLAVYRAGVWHLFESAGGAHRAEHFGLATDLPVARDYDGDGRADLCVYRAGEWYIKSSTSGSVEARLFGLGSDRLVPEDYDGDAKTDIAVFRAGVWYLSQSMTGAMRAERFGLETDALAAGDYDGDGKYDVAVFREGVWYILESSDNRMRVEHWGTAGDVPAR